MYVMTFNIRFDNEMDGLNAWPLRRELVTGLIKKYNPSILGTQEGMWSQLTYLRDHLQDYRLHAPQRTIDAKCQYPTLLFHSHHFEVHEGGEFWLSLTPDIHLSKDWDSAFPRMMSYARVSTFSGKGPFWLAVTHLDHVGSEARYQQAKIIADWVKKRTEPVVLMGDFNDRPGSPIHGLLTSTETGLKDSWNGLGYGEGTDSFTHHKFTGSPQETRMDWVLVSPHFKIMAADIIRDNADGRYPSDHFPYMVELDLEM